jgi:hypothetical protein
MKSLREGTPTKARAYAAPRLERYGSVNALTAGGTGATSERNAGAQCAGGGLDDPSRQRC